jgi:hypothetical protein
MHNNDIGIGSRGVRPMKAKESAAGRHALRLAVIVAGTLFLGGCGISQITSGLGSGVFGSSEEEPEEAGWTATITEEGMLEAARDDSSGRIDASGPASGCPRFKIWPADRHITIYEPGRVGERLAMRHRGSITKVARECQIEGQQVSIKYGFSGRVLMGPRGEDGAVELPVNLYLTRADGTKIRTERAVVNVELRRETPVDYFSVVRTISFEAEPGTAPSSYKLFVAFDREIPGAS